MLANIALKKMINFDLIANENRRIHNPNCSEFQSLVVQSLENNCFAKLVKYQPGIRMNITISKRIFLKDAHKQTIIH